MSIPKPRTIYDVIPLEILQEISKYLFIRNDENTAPCMANFDGYSLVQAFPYCFSFFFPRVGFVYLQNCSEVKQNRLEETSAKFTTDENIYTQYPQLVLLTHITHHSHHRIYTFTFERIAYPETIHRKAILNKTNLYNLSNIARFDRSIQTFQFYGVHRFSLRCIEEMEEDPDLLAYIKETFEESFDYHTGSINALDTWLRDDLEIVSEKTEVEVMTRLRLLRLLYNP